MPPIRQGDGTGISDVRLGDGTQIGEVRKGDGTVLWSSGPDIPDSEANQKLIHRWVLNDVNGAIEDYVGSAGGSNNGIVSVSGDYAGGSAGQGDGSSHIETTTLGSFGSDMGSDFAIAFTLSTTTNFHWILGSAGSGSSLYTGISTGQANAGEFEFAIADGSDTYQTVVGETSLDDGFLHRVVLNKTANNAAGMDVWSDQSEATTRVIADGGPSNWQDFVNAVLLFALNNGGTVSYPFDGVLDDICVFGDSLTSTEIQSYQNPWQ